MSSYLNRVYLDSRSFYHWRVGHFVHQWRFCTKQRSGRIRLKSIPNPSVFVGWTFPKGREGQPQSASAEGTKAELLAEVRSKSFLTPFSWKNFFTCQVGYSWPGPCSPASADKDLEPQGAREPTELWLLNQGLLLGLGWDAQPVKNHSHKIRDLFPNYIFKKKLSEQILEHFLGSVMPVCRSSESMVRGSPGTTWLPWWQWPVFVFVFVFFLYFSQHYLMALMILTWAFWHLPGVLITVWSQPATPFAGIWISTKMSSMNKNMVG